MAKTIFIFLLVANLFAVQGFEDIDAVSLLQSRAKFESETALSPTLLLAPQGWSDAFLQEDLKKTDLSLAPQGWLDAENVKIDVNLRLAPKGFSNATEASELRTGFFENCGATLHHVTVCSQCSIDFCASGLWQANTPTAEAGYAVGSSVPLWGCDNMPADPYVIRNSGSGAIYVVADDPGLATSTLHHVTACDQCGVSFCTGGLWKKNSAYVEAGYTVGSSLPDWGCMKLPANPYIVRNSGSGAIYVVEMESAGTLHHVTDCDQCGVSFCSSTLWNQNSLSAEAGYTAGTSLSEWGCSSLPSTPYVVRNSGTGAIYVVEMEDVGTLHHVTSCSQCGVEFCGSSTWKENNGNAEAGYELGDSLPDWGCSNLPANPYVIRNSVSGAIYVVEVCENVETPATTTTTTVVAVDDLSDDMSESDDGESEQGGEIADQQLDIHECKTWCSSKKHKNKPWDQKCQWYSCSGCPECDAF